MSGTKHIMRIEIIRNNRILNTIIPKNEGIDDFKISSSSSLYSFPTLTIKSSNPDICTSFMGFSKADLVRFSMAKSINDEYKIIFEGEFNKKTIKIDGDPKLLTIEVDSTHSFFKLSMFELASSREFVGVSFKDFVSELIEMAGISSKVEIDPELADIKIFGLSQKTNAFRLFKEVCLILNTTAIFNSDNTVSIDYRSKRLKKIRSSRIHEIGEKDIISMNSEERI